MRILGWRGISLEVVEGEGVLSTPIAFNKSQQASPNYLKQKQ